MNVKRINKFIKGQLVKRIREDAGAYRILNERDLESLVYHELRKKLDKYEDVKISTNFTVSGISWKRKSGGAGKFIQPDIVILESRDKRLEHKPKMRVAIELKARTPGKSIHQGIDTYRTLFSSKTLQKDFKKLNKLEEDSLIDTGYFLYLFHDTINKESSVKKILEKEFPNITDRKRGVRRKFKIIMINKFEKYVEGDSDHKAKIFRHRSRQLHRYYAGKDKGLWKECQECHEVLPHRSEKLDTEHKKKKKKNKKPKRSSGKRSTGGVKAWNGSVLLIARMRSETRRERGLRMPTKKQIAAARRKRDAAKKKRKK